MTREEAWDAFVRADGIDRAARDSLWTARVAAGAAALAQCRRPSAAKAERLAVALKRLEWTERRASLARRRRQASWRSFERIAATQPRRFDDGQLSF